MDNHPESHTPATRASTSRGRPPISRNKGCFLVLGIFVAFILVVSTAIGIWRHNNSDDRWKLQAEAFMAVIDRDGSGSHEQYSQLDGFIENTWEYLRGEYKLEGHSTSETFALIKEAADAAGYDYECRRWHKVCAFTEDGEPRGYVTFSTGNTFVILKPKVGPEAAAYDLPPAGHNEIY